ncbi:hypothetical protein SeLEV6574_g07583 [Synchytrium endobioticum]|uniref:ATP-dependent RNA helicase n=1 Tax=Synchytrium endobioticum TaxID=286115 RepID=A0A507CH34_9FUNG|nr:hypothetical protein SeLEV6574_g07583 [Synchytrium endobioticum]
MSGRKTSVSGGFGAMNASGNALLHCQPLFSQLPYSFSSTSNALQPSALQPKSMSTMSSTDSPSNGAAMEESVAAEEATESNDVADHTSAPQTKKFRDITALSPSTLKSLEYDFKYTDMTQVQERVLSLIPTTSDLLVRAKTGTGKTLAFLIAALESVLSQAQQDAEFKKLLSSGRGVSVMVLSPTRELALQIGREASVLLRNSNFKVHCMVGGNDKRKQMREFDRTRCDFVVATPGRLLDLLTSERTFKAAAEYARILILDEADTLLEMGFKDEITTIMSELPKTPRTSTQPRQTMLFSATLSPGIRSIAKSILQPTGKFIDTIPENEIPTHLKIKQSGLIVPYSIQLPVLYHVIKDHIRNAEKDGHLAKIMVFCSSTKFTEFLANIFDAVLAHVEVLQMHSRLSMMQRTNIATNFRKMNSKHIVMFTSDVSARGVDYPGVSLVIQSGQPQDVDQYIHRIGRTARAGRSGEAITIVSPYERGFLNRDLADLPIERTEIMDLKTLNLSPEDEKVVTEQIPAAVERVSSEKLNGCYSAWLSYYKQVLKNLGLETTIRASHEFGRGVLGAKSDSDLSISPRQAQNLGVSRARGILIRDNRGYDRNDGDRRSGAGGFRDTEFRSALADKGNTSPSKEGSDGVVDSDGNLFGVLDKYEQDDNKNKRRGGTSYGRYDKEGSQGRGERRDSYGDREKSRYRM